jgi:hypothetical protein
MNVRAAHMAVEPFEQSARSLRELLEEALEPLQRKSEVIWFGSLAHRQRTEVLNVSGLAGSDIDLTILSDNAEEAYEISEERLRKLSIALARSNYGSHISVVSETPSTFLQRLDQRPDLWNAIWRDGTPLWNSDSILNSIQRSRVRPVSGDLLVRYAVRSLELAALQIALASTAKAPEEILNRILARKLDGAIWPLAYAFEKFSKDKESSRQSVLSFLGWLRLRDVETEDDYPSSVRRRLDRLFRLTDITLAEADASSSATMKARARIEQLEMLLRSAASNWPNFTLPIQIVRSILHNSGAQYAFLQWAFLKGGITELFEQQDAYDASS